MRKCAIGRYLVRLRRVWRDILFRGLTLATLTYFCISVVGNNPERTEEKQSKEYTEQYGNEAERQVASYTFWLDVLTASLAVSTLGLWVATVANFQKQAVDTRRALRIARDFCECSPCAG